MSISESILFFFSKQPALKAVTKESLESSVGNSLNFLRKVFPDFIKHIANKKVLDFGCGAGYQSIALAKYHACTVVGLDTNEKTLAQAKKNSAELNLGEETLVFSSHLSQEMLGKFDVVISQDSFEHFSNPDLILEQMRNALNSDGKIFITFGPPWYAPYGSHMHFFCKLPWVNLFFSEQTVMKVRSHFRNDGATKYEQVESGLNKMTVTKFESIVRNSGLKIEYRNYLCVKKMSFLSKIPVVRELFINNVAAILTRK